MEPKKITFKEHLNNYTNFYKSMVDLLESINKPTQEEKIQLKIYKAILIDTKSLINHYNYEIKLNK